MAFKFLLAVAATAMISFAAPATSGIGKEYRGAFRQERKVERGSRAVIRNELGSVTIAGWDRETIEAFARNPGRSEVVPVSIQEESEGNTRILFVSTGHREAVSGKVNLEVRLPRYVQLDPIYTGGRDVTVADMDGGVTLKTDNGNIKVRRVGAPAGGVVDITTGNGNVELSDIRGDVRVVSISGKITIECVEGDVGVQDTSSQITIAGVRGDVEVTTSTGRVDFTGVIHSEGRYRLKTLTGAVSMSLPDTIGFTVLLSSYRGHIDTDFDFQGGSQAPLNKINQRIIGRHGDGKARIELDSFVGSIGLRKIDARAVKSCQN